MKEQGKLDSDKLETGTFECNEKNYTCYVMNLSGNEFVGNKRFYYSNWW